MKTCWMESMGWLDIAGDKISELEDTAIEIVQNETETKRKKNLKTPEHQWVVR